MVKYMPDSDATVLVIWFCDDPVLITANIEDHEPASLVRLGTRIAEVVEGLPIATLDELLPSPQNRSRLINPFHKILQFLRRDQFHDSPK